MHREIDFRNGMEVFGSDGGKVGKIVEIDANYIVVEKGFFFPSDHFIPRNAIESVDEDEKVYLSVTKDAALNQGWETVPESLLDDRDVTASEMTGDGPGAANGPTSAGFDASSDAALDAVVTGQTRQDTRDPMMPEAENPTSYAGDPAYRDAGTGTDRVVTAGESERQRTRSGDTTTGTEPRQTEDAADASDRRSESGAESSHK